MAVQNIENGKWVEWTYKMGIDIFQRLAIFPCLGYDGPCSAILGETIRHNVKQNKEY